MCLLKILGLSLLGILLAVGNGFAAAEVVTVVSPQNPLAALTRSEISNLFLGKTSRFPGGAAAVSIDQPEGSAPRVEFYQNVSNKRPAEIKAHWSKMIFTGRGQPPRVVDGDEQMKQVLAGQPNGIGYINSAAVDDSVKVLAVQ